MGQLRYTILISALAAASLAAVGCEQRTSGDKVGQLDRPAQQIAPAAGQMTAGDQTAANSQGKGPVAASMDDTMITAKVKAALLAEPGLKSTLIDVTTRDATVTLSGAVDSPAMRDRAKQVALSTEGVKDVVDNMNLKSTS
jgi:hyperosmotically inducible periplasmic protein